MGQDGRDAAWPRGSFQGLGGGGGAAALLLLGALAGCGGSPATQADAPRIVSAAGYSRPASHEPPGPPGDPWGPWIRDASRRFDIPDRWIREVMRQESGGRANATSPVGAMGLMQVMPGTYRELRSRYGLGDDPYHPYDSLMAGTAYLREMYELYGSPAFLAAYNAGPRRLEDYLWNNRGLPTETRNYVARIGPRIAGVEPGRRAAPEIVAAAEIPFNIPPGPRRMDGSTMLALRQQREAADPGIRVATLPPGPVVRMEPIPDGSTYAEALPPPAAQAWVTPPAAQAWAPPSAAQAWAPPPAAQAWAPPVQVAGLGAPFGTAFAAPFGTAPGGPVVRMDPIPDGSTPEGAARLAEVADRAVPEMPPAPIPAPAPSVLPAPTPVAIAPPRLAMPLPPRATPSPVPAPMLAVRPAAPPTPQFAQQSAPRFGLIGSAQAATAAPWLAAPATAAPRLAASATATPRLAAPATATSRLTGSSQGWAVQVGAFASVNLARNAAEAARERAGTLGTRAIVQPLAQSRVTLYRARVTGLSRDDAQALCDRLRGRGDCILLSPDAQG